MTRSVVPVFVGTDGLVLPFENDVDWAAMSVRIPRERAHETPRILARIPTAEYERMSELVWRIGRTTVIEPDRGTVWRYIARELRRRRVADQRVLE